MIQPSTILLSDELTSFQKLIVCIANAYASTEFEEKTNNNADAWIADWWACYHQYENYGAYCMVTAANIVNSAAKLAVAQGGAKCETQLVPNRPSVDSKNREKTLYGNVYDTLQELLQTNAELVDQAPQVGSVFMRPGDTGRNNHAGIVVAAPLRDDVYIETIEGNVSTSGFGGNRKGFQLVRYSKAGYDAFANRTWVKSSRAKTAYGDATPKGWYYYHAWKSCDTSAVSYSAELCLGVKIRCDQQTPPPPLQGEKQCPDTPPPSAPGFTNWYSLKAVLAEIIAESAASGRIGLAPKTSRKYPAEGRETSADGCFVRWRIKDGTPPPPPPTPPQTKNPCPTGLILKSCCEGASTTVRMASASQMLTLADMREVGGRQSLISTALPTNAVKERGYQAKYTITSEMWPQVRLANGSTVTVVYKASESYALAEQYGLFGPAPAIIEIDRTQIYQGEGAGWVERVADMFAPGNTRQVDADEVIIRDDLNLLRNLIRGNRLSMFDLLQTLDEKPDLYKGRQPVIVISGDPTIGIDILESASGLIGAGLNLLVPGIGTLVSQAITLSANAYRNGTISIQDAFSFVGGLAAGLSQVAGSNNDGKQFGVDAKVFADIARYSATSNNVYSVLASSSGDLQKATSIGAILERDVPEIRQYLTKEFATEEQWIRNAFAEINSNVNGVLVKARASVQNVADSFATSTIGNLKRLFGSQGTDGLFADLLTNDQLGFTKSVAKISTFQELLTSSPHPTLLNTRAGAQDIFGRILSLPATFVADVRDGAVHNALASVVTGKRVVDGALDQLTLDSLLYKAEDFARKKWKFDLPLTIPEDKRECYRKEIAVCVGTECCAPKVMVSGVCMPPGSSDKQECVREQNGQLLYCEPPECGSLTTTANTLETATITSRSNSGTPYELSASRITGTREWGSFKVLAYEPELGTNRYRRPVTEPVDLSVSGVVINSDDFESLRQAQNVEIKRIPLPSRATDATTTSGPCFTVRPARLVPNTTNQYEVQSSTGWVRLKGCCPETSADRPIRDGVECCTEVRTVLQKVDQLATMVSQLGQTVRQDVAIGKPPSLVDETRRSTGTGVAPQTDKCDLTEVLALLRQLPYEINRVGSIDTTRVSVDPNLIAVNPRGRTSEDTANITGMQAALARIETAIANIKTGSPCDNTQVLSSLVRIQAELQKATIQYDDTVVQKKLDTLTQLVAQRQVTNGDVTNLNSVLSELQATRRDYADVIRRLQEYCTGNVQVCDTQTLRNELNTQTQTIIELRRMLESGVRVDTTAVERELMAQRDLLQIIVERLESQKVVTDRPETGKRDVTETIIRYDDTQLRNALTEFRATVELVPIIRQELVELRENVDRQHDVLKAELGTANTILRELQSRKDSTTVVDEIRAQRKAVDNLERKLDAVLNRQETGIQEQTGEGRRNQVMTRRRTDDCEDCPAYVEENRKVFYRYPTATQLQQSQTQQYQGLPPQPPVTVLPVEMPCDFC